MSNKKQTSVDKIKLEIEKIKALAQDKADKNSDRPMSEAVIEADACIEVCNYLLLTVLPLAKELEKHQHGTTWDNAIQAHEDRGHNLSRSLVDFDEYFEKTYEQ